ncbi:hypothetical protein Thein_2080 [Thermodesulfatator indicus DSM 15286]|uniref:Calcineurin-like phosphoesterase domain-containing protein n=1 Tax=Thermodesulfatator indicus (strain DSM 15286 / JCM 11887 / CIR29812) TaxID=667014 RepID=F8ADB4_THEID|nr:hypothetical protein [Thermodesulfatator indicus]AEH45929.1 hypothetical protein Thein_2080 [Thermodesulfatator indicus DSM 15286]
MRVKNLIFLLICFLLLYLVKISFAAKDYVWSDKSFKIAVLPNEIIDKGKIKTITINSINQSDIDLVIFTGDTKDGSSVCSDEVIGKKLIDYFNKINAPVIYSVGDNEWTDCHRVSNGSYDPLERLSYIRRIFFNKPYTQGKNHLPVDRQGKLGDKFSENSRLIYHNVMLVSLHVVGSNNNLVSSDKLCFKKSKRTWKDCEKATDEYRERNKANIKWLKESFAIAKKKNLKAVIVAIQADIYYPYVPTIKGYKKFLKNLNEKNGFTDFFNVLKEETISFPGQVLLVHGDTHFFQFDKPMFFESNWTIVPNFSRVETFGGKETSWVEITVNPNDPQNMFVIKPVVLPAL